MQIHDATFIKGIRGSDRILEDGRPQIAFIGRSNVGKSSLINALLNEKDLVKTGKKPGKTTEINFFSINRGKFYFVDLPGYGFAKINPELKEKIRKLILWYIQFSNVKPQCVVLVLDVKAGVTAFDRDMIDILAQAGHRYVIAVNKVDKLNRKELGVALKEIAHDARTEVVPCSAQTKDGVQNLLDKILN